MTTKRQLKREQRLRDKNARRRVRQEREWRRQHPVRPMQTTEELRQELERIELKDRLRRANMVSLDMATVLVAGLVARDKVGKT